MQSACAVLYYLWPVWLHLFFHIISSKARFSGKKVIEHKMCALIFSIILSENVHILRRIQRDIINVHRSSCKVPVILVLFQWKLNFLDSIKKKPQISTFIKIWPVRAEWFHADKRTDGQTWRSWQSLFAILLTPASSRLPIGQRLQMLRYKICSLLVHSVDRVVKK